MTERVPVVPFTKEMAKTHTILFPNMIEIHFRLVKAILEQEGYKAEVLLNEGPAVSRLGQKHVHNDTCYPALLVIGQMIDALQSGKYDPDRVALILPQTAGGCRASNYIFLLRKALKNAGFGQVPVLSLNLNGMEEQEGFSVSLKMLQKMVAAMAYGDLLMLLANQVRPYEVHEGQTDMLVDFWTGEIAELFESGKGTTLLSMKRQFARIVEDFSMVETEARHKVKTGVVGEIYVKYAPLANNHLTEFLESQSCEVMVPGILQFLLYTCDMPMEDVRLYGGSKVKMSLSGILYQFLKRYETALLEAVRKEGKFAVPCAYAELKELAKPLIGTGCKMGEGWLLTAEMAELIEKGYGNIVCTQPFGCLPNHIAGKAMMHKLRKLYPASNIVAVDYDPGAARVNQENRIKLMLAMARE